MHFSLLFLIIVSTVSMLTLARTLLLCCGYAKMIRKQRMQKMSYLDELRQNCVEAELPWTRFGKVADLKILSLIYSLIDIFISEDLRRDLKLS